MSPAWALLAWFGAAVAQAPETDAPEPADEEPPAVVIDHDEPPEVVVYGSLHEAREAVVRAAKEAGYTRRIERRDRTILRHDDPWKGEIVLHRDGRVEVKRQPIRFEPPGDKRNAANYIWCALLIPCLRTSGQTAAPRLYRSNERAALAAIHDEVVAYQERLGTQALDLKLATLPDRLARFWDTGEAFADGYGPAGTWEERRAVIFAYWDSRTETEWGEQVRDVVEAFVRGVVQTSEHPYTPEEIAALNARRSVRRTFLPPLAVEVFGE